MKNTILIALVLCSGTLVAQRDSSRVVRQRLVGASFGAIRHVSKAQEENDWARQLPTTDLSAGITFGYFSMSKRSAATFSILKTSFTNSLEIDDRQDTGYEGFDKAIDFRSAGYLKFASSWHYFFKTGKNTGLGPYMGPAVLLQKAPDLYRRQYWVSSDKQYSYTEFVMEAHRARKIAVAFVYGINARYSFRNLVVLLQGGYTSSMSDINRVDIIRTRAFSDKQSISIYSNGSGFTGSLSIGYLL